MSAVAGPDGPSRGLAATAAALRDGAVTAAELVDGALDRIAASQPRINAFRLVRRAAARREAAAADERLAAGERAPLLGVPVAVKDDTETAGDDTRFGTPVDVAGVPGDAPVVRRLRAAGAVIVGKTATCEFGQWPFTSGDHGTTRNPWDPGRSPGGSSGGSAAAVAAGLVPAAVGSDGAGSIRIPAAWTHLVGVRPANGTVPIRGGAAGFHGLTVNGPLARTARDAALLLDVLAGAGGRLARAARRPPGRLRVGVTLRSPIPGVPARPHPDVVAAVRQTAGTLAALGHEVATVRPRWGLAGLGFLPRSLAGVHAWARRVADPGRLDPRTRENARLGAWLRGPALSAALRAVPWLRRRVGRVFDRVDVLLAPTTALPAHRAGSYDGLPGWRTSLRMVRACPYAWPWNVLGWPGVNVPAGFTGDGLPVGAQLLGPDGSTPRLLALAGQLDDDRLGRLRPAPAGHPGV